MTRTEDPRTARPVVTVLGASGFIGSALVAALAPLPVTVRAVARWSGDVRLTAPGAGVEARKADATVPGELRAAVAGSDTVVDLLLPSAGWRAGGEEAERLTTGVVRDLVAWARTERHRPVVVFAGSVSQAGHPPRLPLDGSETDRPQGPYDRRKHEAELLLKAATADGTLRGVSLRLPTVYGTGPGGRCADRGVLATMARRALAEEPLTVWGDGGMERDLLHVRDAAAAFAAAVARPGPLCGGHWVIGTGEGRRLRDAFRAVADSVAARYGRPPVPVVSVPSPPAASETDMSGVVVDASAFTAVTGWRAEVPFHDGLDRLVGALARERRLG
ncbi:NAD(P)-dependent oxidoreductase [Actinomadura sp. BRA 177]|uniref:NAD-dependent epimerase/dehydratase family protein n=1 Tax=Actinomadura sp. BRA 177 TaxID=2745202 RepID=UPI0015962CFA|nr:NAD-dependent epimerase/dehydratase family protein [Actinomadura sp. BRA 177]NVI88941.1 NAD-dependent epimerase/dehydratase family protein [Actinomadura sp. BRA 177]